MEKKMILCKDLVSYDSLGTEQFSPCNRKAKYKVKYRNAVNGNSEIRFVCGIHCNSIKIYASRMKKICDYDVELEVTNVELIK